MASAQPQEHAMKKTYVTTTDGEQYHAANALDFVKQLKDSSMTSVGLTLNQFMRETAKRAEDATGFKVRHQHSSIFLEDLLRAGLVKEVQAAEQ
jgi:hypothetical protein